MDPLFAVLISHLLERFIDLLRQFDEVLQSSRQRDHRQSNR